MIQEYPKALYTGDQTHYTMLTAHTSEEEQLLRDEGAVDYVDLPEYQAESEYIGETASGDGESVAEQNKALQEELAETKTEIERLKGIIEAGTAENAELRKKLRFKDLEDMGADALKALLDEAKILYQARDSKATLAQLVLDHEIANQT